ncbi:hypothetical protein ACQPXT_32235 [Streptomyces sp. CA-100214]
MAVEQLPRRVGDFTRYLTGLLTRLDQGAGWCGVFWQRDPEGMRACLDGREIPPWDVVEALLQDLAGRYGAAAAEAGTEPARALHAAALTAYDSLPGARDALRDRLDVMLREQRYAAERETRLTRTLSHPDTTPETAASLRLDLAWAHDDHTRATARCTELRSRLTALDAVRRGSGGIRADAGPTTPATGTPRPIPPGADASAHAAGPETPASASDASAPGGVSGGMGGVGPAHRLAPAAYGTSAQRSAPTEPREDPASAYGTSAPDRVSRTPANASRVSRDGARAHGSAPPEGPARLPGAPAPTTPPAPTPTTPPRNPAPKQRKRRRGGARFAGGVDADASPVVPGQVPVPVAPGRRTPRGARFAGAEEAGEQPVPSAPDVPGEGIGPPSTRSSRGWRGCGPQG